MKRTTAHFDPRHRAFTIIELMVVILIGLIILTIAVPAFQSMIYSSNRSLAVNSLQAASQMARDVAVSAGQDGAVVFVYDPQIGRMQIIPAVKVGTLREVTPSASGPGNASGLGDTPFFDRDVFVPASTGETLEMPRFWMVRGFAPSGTLIDLDSGGNPHTAWYTSDAYGGKVQVGDAIPEIKKVDHWVFPETGFFPRDAQVAGGGVDGGFDQIDGNLPTARQSFMIRFNARTGMMSRDTNAALFVNPRNSRERVSSDGSDSDRPSSHEQTLRVDMAEDMEVWAARIISSSDLTGDSFAYRRDDLDLRAQLIGNSSNDTILVKPVTRLALYDERKLAIGVGAKGLEKSTQTFYKPVDPQDANARIAFDLDLFPSGISEEQLVDRIDQWVDGNTTFARDGDFDLNLDDEPESRLYLIQSNTGELEEVLR